MIATALLLLSSPVTACPPQERAPSGEVGARVHAYLERLEGVGFSGSVAVSKGGEVVLAQGYGLAERSTNTPVTAETVFTVGSITKQFTAAAIMKLEMQGKLSVQDAIDQYFDDVPADKAGITLHQLLTHSASFPGALGDDFDDEATDEWLFAEAMAYELPRLPGTSYEYSNVGYSLLGMIVERVSGQSYEAFLRDQLFEPAGMRSTGYVLPNYSDERLANGYRQDGERWGTILERPMLPDGPCWNLRANGGIHSTAGDMLRWHEALEGDEILSAAAKEKMFAPHVDEGGGQSYYGYGWSIATTPRNTKRIAHNGGNGIFFADFHRYVDEDVVLFLATGSAQAFRGISRELSRVVFGAPVDMPPQTVERDASTLAPLVGQYDLGEGASVRVISRGDRLVLVAEGDRALGLVSGVRDSAELKDQSAMILCGMVEGDDSEFFSVFSGRMPRHRLERQLDAIRADWSERLGDFEDIVRIEAKAGPEVVRVFAEAKFDRGTEYAVFEWSAGRIVGLGLEDSPPWGGDTGVEVFPLSANEFQAFLLRSGPGVRVTFERNGDSRATALVFGGREPVRAPRK